MWRLLAVPFFLVALTGCDDAILFGPPPAPAIAVASMSPSNGSTRNATPGALYTAEATANRAYSSADGSVRAPSTLVSFGRVEPLNTGELYLPSRPLQVEFRPYDSGQYRFEATFYAPINFASGTSNFQVTLVAAKTTYCPPGDSFAGCTGGGSGGGGGTQWLQYRGLPDQSREPFFLVTNDANGHLTEAEMEARAAQWSPQTRTQMAHFFDVVYDYQLPSGARSGGEGASQAERLRTYAAALDRESPRADGSRWESAVADVLVMLDSEPVFSHAVGSVSAKTTPEGTASDLSAFPNPAVLSMTIQVPEGTQQARIFDVLGREVAQLDMAAGAAMWNLLDASGRRVAPGAYVIVADALTGRVTRRVTVL